VEGVVFHILKGQIEYDFMLARLEPLLERHDLPVFRLETDYQAQDVEQLRIRLEAFGEMLEQRAFANGHLQAQRRYA
jgi:benzoyl-CoA reductase/2-hydroxyglutaryl-CoA dehydratase subunit BcrC/BadD/HgdB